MSHLRKIVPVILLTFFSLCLLAAAVSWLSNQGLPQGSAVIETLSQADKIHLAEEQHLRQQVGDTVWPGWGQADIPAIRYNEEYAFLTGYSQPPDGWIKVPAGTVRGGPWEAVPDDTYQGQPYYRQALAAGITPEAFTVQVGERWVSSIQTRDWAGISLTQTIRRDLPDFLQPVFPYRLFISQLVGGSEKYISLAAHEAFHAYQGMTAADKFSAAEMANLSTSSQYPWDDPTFQADWGAELDLLAQALRSDDQEEILHLAEQFLALRSTRRTSAGLPQALADYENQREWVEGLARYVELEIWRQAAREMYTPIPETSALDDFHGYARFDSRWSQELSQIGRMADDEGDGRFYYSGMAQAFLLDRLQPDWKLQAFEQNIWLETLLANVVSSNP